MTHDINYQVVINGNTESQENVFDTLKEARARFKELTQNSEVGTVLDIYKHLYSVKVLSSYMVESQTESVQPQPESA